MFDSRQARGLLVVTLMAMLVGAGALGHAIRSNRNDAEETAGKLDDLQQTVDELTDRVDELETKVGAQG